ncbi:unnamed protein product [Phaedon cochleariae]|uniref:Alpha-carbonic anhydrase domain-containing protein n=1 Tax=Phaedon cochleariae TaxID=80249 RepID=A0A9P0DXR8_PHACE|nr:unnamed protein product [Phaedon cochleariae]
MDWLTSYLPEEVGSHFHFLILSLLVLGGLYLNDLWHQDYAPRSSPTDTLNLYGYSEYDGPAVWRRKYQQAGGSRQSPINIQDACAIDMPSGNSPQLVFTDNFHAVPQDMKLYNNGHNVVVYATWMDNKRPSLIGGPLTEDYNLLNLRFRWGPNDYEGSEHMINSSRFAMELQAAFVKGTAASDDILDAAKKGSLLMVSYLFLVTPVANPYLEPVIDALKYLRCPMSCINIEPVILSLLMPAFSRDYYTYTGSLTFPPCTEGVKWIVKPEPLMISSEQLKKFRKLYGANGRITNNTRPVQKVNNRDVFYYG